MKGFSLSLLMVVLAAGSRLSADSLWPQGSANFGNESNVISDRRALKVGDLVTVKIIETASASQSTNTKTQKEGSVSGGAGPGSWGRGGGFPLESYGAGARTNFEGGGSSERTGKLVTTVTARVISILDSGNLVIEGRRMMKVNSEKQHIYVRGIIRPSDVNHDNTILSSVISDAQITYEGFGPLSEKSKEGIFTRILSWLGIL